MTSFVEKLKHKLEKTVTDIVDELTVPDEVKEARMNICYNCEYFFKITSQCKKCGCYMPAKTVLAKVSCPIKKWDKFDQQ